MIYRHAFLYPFVCIYNISHFRLIPLRLCLLYDYVESIYSLRFRLALSLVLTQY